MTLTRLQVAKWLLKEEHLLTALEFHTELKENGVSLELLAEYFQNPANFEIDPNTDSIPADQPRAHLTPSRTKTGTVETVPLTDYTSLTERLRLMEIELSQSRESEANLRAQVAQLHRKGSSASPTSRRSSVGITKSAPMRKQIAAGTTNATRTLSRRRSLAGKSSNVVTNLPREQKQAITAIVHQYLVQSGNKETANTFADEAGDPDFDDWQLVGLPHEPPPLHLIFKQHCNAKNATNTLTAQTRSPGVLDILVKPTNSKISSRVVAGGFEVRNQTTDSDTPRKDVGGRKSRNFPGPPKSTAYKAEQESNDEGLPMRRVKSETRFMSVEQELTLDIEHLRRGYEAMKQTNGHLRARNEELQTMVDQASFAADEGSACARTASEREEKDMHMTLERMYSVNTLRQRPLAYRKAIETVSLYGSGKDRLSLEVIHIKKHNDDPVDVLGWCLPNIIPHVLVKRRDELIPALIITIQRHRKPKVRDQLTNILFNLVRKPTENQRRAIVNGCSILAERIGPLRVEAELLPQCWEQINHPHAERRILVADTCGKLARFVKPELRSSLVVSILTQLMEDTSDMVRQSAVKNLGLVVTYLEGKDKHKSLTKLLILAILDRNDRVVRAAEALYLPSMAQSACELDLLCTSFLPTLYTSLENAMGKMIELAPQPNVMFGGNQYKQRQARQQQTPHNLEAARETKNVLMHIEALCLLVPFLYAYLLRASPFGTLVQDETALAPTGRTGSFGFSGGKDGRGVNGQTAEGLAMAVLEDEVFNDALGAEPSWLDAMEDDDFWKDMEAVDEDRVDSDDQDQALVLTRKPSFTKHAENLLFATSTLLGSDSIQARLQLKLDEHVSRSQVHRPGDELANWPAFYWMKDEWLSNLVSMVSVCPLENESATFALSRLIFLTCVTFGEVYTRTLVQPLYVKMLALQPNEAKSADTTAAEVRSVRARVVVAYLCGVLRASSLKDQCQRLLSEFQKLMTDIATNKNGWTTDDYPLLEIVVRMLCKSDEALIADVVSLMWDMIVSPDAAIRATSPYLVQGLLLCCDVVTLRDRVLPAVITLSSDENMDVRVSTIPVFGHILESVNDKGVQDKIKMQLQSLLETDDVNALLLMFEVLSMLANIMPTIETSFRDDFIIPRLYDISCRTHQHNNDEVRVARVVALLVKTVVAAVQSELPLVVLQKYVQPTCDTLQMLPRTCVRVEDDETLAEISVECTERLSASNVAAHAISESLSTTKQKFKNFFNKNEDDDSHVDTNGMENMRNAMKTSTPPPGAATNAFANLFKTRG